MVTQTINLPLLDGGEVFDPSFVTDQTLNLPLIDGGHAFAPNVTGTPVVGMQVFEEGLFELTETWARSFRDELSDPGSFRLSLENDDPFMPGSGDLVYFYVDGLATFAGLVEARNITTYGQGEEADEVTVLMGRSTLARTDYATVEPARGLDALPTELVRSFSWVSVDYDDTEWPDSKRTLHTSHGRPEWWPTPTWWVWANRPDVGPSLAPGGRCLFRSTIDLADDAALRIFVGLDNYGTVWFDGAQIVDTDVGGQAFRFGEYVEIPEVSAGDHVLALSCLNTGLHGGVTFSVWSVDAEGLLDELIAVSDSDTVKCLPYPYPNNMPGFSPGKAIRLMVEEAQDRSELTDINLGFSDTLDSDGEPWTEPAEITVECGRTVLEALAAMSEWIIDVQMTPTTTKILRAWNWGTRGGTPGVEIEATEDPATSEIEALVHDARPTKATRLLIKFRGGWTEVGVPPYSQFVDLGHVETETAAKRIGQRLLAFRNDESFSHTLTLAPVASKPYAAFDIGDTVTHPDQAGDPLDSRVRSIAVTEDDNGELTYVLELNDLRREVEERHDIWLKRAAAGSLAGGAKVTTKSGEAIKASSRISFTDVVEFSTDATLSVGVVDLSRPASTSGNIIQVYAKLATAGSSSTSLRIIKNGVSLGTITIASGETVGTLSVAAVKVHRDTDVFVPEIITAGTGAKGIDIQVRAI